jgi:electron transfer flavoprotein alpha subunit
MREILVIIEDLADGPAELAAAARSIPDAHVTAAVFGTNESDWTAAFDRVLSYPATADGSWDADYIAACLTPWIEQNQPYLVLMQHTNNGLDLAPWLAARCDRPLLADCLSLEFREQGLAAVRTWYGGKVHARVAAEESANGYFATLRPGAFDSAKSGSGAAELIAEQAPAGYQARRRHVETVTPEAGAVDITQAEVLVAVGRGIEEEENLEVVQSLAEAMGAELACTRPVVDKQWLDKSRQVGTSGLTVKPRVYLTVGVSGSFQHLGGVKGGPFMVAINQDAAAPIFASADVGVVGDLFDLVPLLEEKIRELKG